jgi:DNA-directed RNA polymerase specialized sigma24 family protein
MGVTWSEIPNELELRIRREGASAVGDLATWAYTNRPNGARNDDIHDLLCALIRYLNVDRQIRSIPALLAAIAFRQKCQRFYDKVIERSEPLREDPMTDEPEALSSLAQQEFEAELSMAVRRLRPVERDAIERKHLLGQHYHEIAVALYGCAGLKEEKRLSAVLTRARMKLRWMLKVS